MLGREESLLSRARNPTIAQSQLQSQTTSTPDSSVLYLLGGESFGGGPSQTGGQRAPSEWPAAWLGVELFALEAGAFLV